jgi:hypothetical protein
MMSIKRSNLGSKYFISAFLVSMLVLTSLTLLGTPVEAKGGFDKWGYNRQANMFNGLYCNWALQKFLSVNHDTDESNDVGPASSAEEAQQMLDDALAAGTISSGEYGTASYYNGVDYGWGNTNLIMKWNDAWTAGNSGEPWIGSGAWITNHMRDSYVNEDGKKCQWIYFTKIVAAPEGAYKTGGFWYTADGAEIGPVIWTNFATILDVYNDQCAGSHGAEYVSPASPGFGYYK